MIKKRKPLYITCVCYEYVSQRKPLPLKPINPPPLNSES